MRGFAILLFVLLLVHTYNANSDKREWKSTMQERLQTGKKEAAIQKLRDLYASRDENDSDESADREPLIPPRSPPKHEISSSNSRSHKTDGKHQKHRKHDSKESKENESSSEKKTRKNRKLQKMQENLEEQYKRHLISLIPRVKERMIIIEMLKHHKVDLCQRLSPLQIYYKKLYELNKARYMAWREKLIIRNYILTHKKNLTMEKLLEICKIKKTVPYPFQITLARRCLEIHLHISVQFEIVTKLPPTSMNSANEMKWRCGKTSVTSPIPTQPTAETTSDSAIYDPWWILGEDTTTTRRTASPPGPTGTISEWTNTGESSTSGLTKTSESTGRNTEEITPGCITEGRTTSSKSTKSTSRGWTGTPGSTKPTQGSSTTEKTTSSEGTKSTSRGWTGTTGSTKPTQGSSTTEKTTSSEGTKSTSRGWTGTTGSTKPTQGSSTTEKTTSSEGTKSTSRGWTDTPGSTKPTQSTSWTNGETSTQGPTTSESTTSSKSTKSTTIIIDSDWILGRDTTTARWSKPSPVPTGTIPEWTNTEKSSTSGSTKTSQSTGWGNKETSSQGSSTTDGTTKGGSITPKSTATTSEKTTTGRPVTEGSKPTTAGPTVKSTHAAWSGTQTLSGFSADGINNANGSGKIISWNITKPTTDSKSDSGSSLVTDIGWGVGIKEPADELKKEDSAGGDLKNSAAATEIAIKN
nr:PREDICTED: flocculation protein FLO11-like isoform X2 [Megachile rotundata]